jgi:hypothetical protein
MTIDIVNQAPLRTPPCSGRDCGRVGVVWVDRTALEAYENGAPAARAFAALRPEVIEQIETGTCAACWPSLHPRGAPLS